jgi:2-oxoglutarate ferredoxin oxidoreductase subunit beta
MPEGKRQLFKVTPLLTNVSRGFCPGCTHGIIHRLLCEVIEELNLFEKTVLIIPVGCSTLSVDYFEFDTIQAAHGRAPAVATGVKRARPDLFVCTYQGDGDLASIGTAEIVHSANRGENISVIFVNNGIYGMTGGQMAPTTLIGWKTETSPYGRDPKREGYPIRMCEMLSQLNGPAYIARTAVNNPKNVLATKRAIKKAFTAQLKELGFSMVEILSTCPTNWGMDAVSALKRIDNEVIKYYPLGEYKVAEGL